MWGKGRWGGGITYPSDLWIWKIQNQRTISSRYLKISRIKESPQFGWVKKLQTTAGFQTVRGGYLFFFFKTRLRITEIYNNQVFDYFDNHEYQPWYPAWSTTGLVTISKREPPVWVGEKNFKEPSDSRQFEVDIWFFFQNMFENHRDI